MEVSNMCEDKLKLRLPILKSVCVHNKIMTKNDTILNCDDCKSIFLINFIVLAFIVNLSHSM